MDIKKIKNKFKQCKYQHLKKIYTKNLSKSPENCKYNKEIRLPNKTRINICGFNFEDSYEIDLCYKKEHAEDCNAFCAKRSKKELSQDFENILKDDQLRATHYKDLNVLYWMFPELISITLDNPKWFHKIFRFFKKTR